MNLARADGPGRAVLEREEDVLESCSGSLTGVFERGILEQLRNEWGSGHRRRYSHWLLRRERRAPHPGKKELANARQRGDQIAVPASALSEVRVSPTRHGESSFTAIVGFSQRLPLVEVELDIETAVAAARLRARHDQKLKVPDALVRATVIQLGADVLVTTDRGWPPKSKLGLEGNLIKF